MAILPQQTNLYKEVTTADWDFKVSRKWASIHGTNNNANNQIKTKAQQF